MKKIALSFWIFTILTLLLAACNLRAKNTTPPPNNIGIVGGTLGVPSTIQSAETGTASPVTSVPTNTITASGTSTLLMSTQAVATATNTSLPSSTSIAGLPATGAGPINYLSTLLTFPVVDNTGKLLGTVQDFILNMCEAHILYIVLNPDESIGIQSGSQILVPYSAVTWKTSSKNTADRTLVLDIRASQLSGAPLFNSASIDLTTWDWEADVITFWSKYVKFGLTTECIISSQSPTPTATGTVAAGQATPTIATTPVVTGTPTVTATLPVTPTATPGSLSVSFHLTAAQPTSDRVVVHRIAYAKEVLAADFYNGNGGMIGKVKEVIVIHETGLLRYVVLQADASLDPNQQLYLVPLGAVTVKRQAQTGSPPKLVLVLLVRSDILLKSPAYRAVPDPGESNWDAEAFKYWSQYVPMTLKDLP